MITEKITNEMYEKYVSQETFFHCEDKDIWAYGFIAGAKYKLDQLEEFQKAFNSPCNNSPTNLTKKEILLRFELLKEEMLEYRKWAIKENKVEILDALVDIQYVLLGTVVAHGMQHIFEEAFNRVHSNNMSKLVNGKPLINEEGTEHYDPTKPLGKVLKPKNYVPVDLSDLI
jgi:predicted HAD superfamily Cof-like phosphohydrolase